LEKDTICKEQRAELQGTESIFSLPSAKRKKEEADNNEAIGQCFVFCITPF